MADILLVHSPFVGPLSLQVTGARLDRLGHRVTAPDLRPVWREPPPWIPRLSELAALPGEVGFGEGSVVLVGHSGAGPLLPGIADRVVKAGRDVRALIFLDARLPHPGRSWVQTAPADLVRHARELASGGVMAPWHEWFLPETMEALVPVESMRAAIEAEDPRVPIAFLAEPMPADEWAGPAAYLRLSDGYRDDALAAADLGWLVDELPSDHLAPYTRPADVAAAIDRLVTLLGPAFV